MDSSENLIEMPEKFPAIMNDFLSDLSTTFPEYTYLWGCWQDPKCDITQLYSFCLTVYPERFFDILYQNDEIFLANSEVNTQFLPNVEFKMLFSVTDISENTKKTMWKYLQLILITIMGNIKTSSSFGDAASLFEGIGENELHSKLSETIQGLSEFFKGISKGTEEGTDDEENPNQNTDLPQDFEEFTKKMNESMPEMEEAFKKMFDSGADEGAGEGDASEDKKPAFSFDDFMPNAEDLHGHIKGIFDGKIGTLAKELAEELSGEVIDMFDDGTGEIKSTGEIFKRMMKNPKQIMELIKKIGSKLDDKMKNGNISQEEIMKEAGDLMSKMKGMGKNGKDFQEMMKTMMKSMGPAMGPMANMMGKGSKMDMNKMNSMLNQNSHKQRMLNKLEQKRAQALATQTNYVIEQSQSKKPNEFVFKMPDEGVQEKSAAIKKPTVGQSTVPTPTPCPPPINDDWLDEPVSTKQPKTVQQKSKNKKGKKK